MFQAQALAVWIFKFIPQVIGCPVGVVEDDDADIGKVRMSSR